MTESIPTTTECPPCHAVSIVGAGRLGAPIAACLGAAGFEVIAVDSNRKVVNQLNAGQPPVYETDLAAMLQRAGARLRATTDTVNAVQNTDTTFILVPTPSERDGGFGLKFVTAACEQIGRGIAQKKRFHLVVLVSTVMPGSTGGPVRHTLEQASGKRCGQDFGLCYSPEFVALGSVIENYLNPDFILIGQCDARSGDKLAAIYDRVCTTQPPSARMNFANAELAKIAVNSFITTKITFANTLASICERLPGASVDSITTALGMDSRIGGKCLRGGVGYGGPCFPRDNQALAAVARRVGSSAQLAQSVDVVNRQQVERIAAIVKQNLACRGVIGVLGLAYKPHSDVVEQSQGLLLAAALAAEGLQVIGYDPAAMHNAAAALGKAIGFADTALACVQATDLVVIMTAWPQFESPGEDDCLWQPGRTVTVVDPWRLLAQTPLGDNVIYIAGGVGPTPTSAHKPHQPLTHRQPGVPVAGQSF